jgi:hypothetical protein
MAAASPTALLVALLAYSAFAIAVPASLKLSSACCRASSAELIKNGVESLEEAHEGLGESKNAVEDSKKYANEGEVALKESEDAEKDAEESHTEAMNAMGNGRAAEAQVKNSFAVGEESLEMAAAAGKASKVAVADAENMASQVSELAKVKTEDMNEIEKVQHLLNFLVAQDDTNTAVTKGIKHKVTAVFVSS